MRHTIQVIGTSICGLELQVENNGRERLFFALVGESQIHLDVNNLRDAWQAVHAIGYGEGYYADEKFAAFVENTDSRQTVYRDGSRRMHAGLSWKALLDKPTEAEKHTA